VLSNHQTRFSWTKLVDNVLWLTYLILLLSASFINDIFSSYYWLLFSSCTYGVAAVFKESPAWFSPDSYLSITPAKTRWLFNSELMIFTIFCLSISLLRTRRRLKQLLWLILAVGLIHSIIAISAKYSATFLVDIKQLDGHFNSARGWFINRNHFASFIVLSLVGALSYQIRISLNNSSLNFLQWVKKQLANVNIFLLGSIFISVIAVLLSQSRAAFLGFLLSFVLVTFIAKKINIANFSLLSRRSVALVCVVVALSLVYFGSDVIDRFSSDSLLGERIKQWNITIVAVKHSPVFGFGGNSYADVFQIIRPYQEFRQVLYNQAHNDYLHILLEQGILGLSFWLLFLYCLNSVFS